MFGTVVLEHGRQRDASREMLLKRSSLVGRRKTADTMGLGTGGNMMVPGRGGEQWSFLAPFRSGRSESASLGDAEGPFETSVKGQRDMKPGPGVEGKPMAVRIRTG